MRLFFSLAFCIATVTFFGNVIAHSRARNPLNYLTLVESPRIHTPSHRIHAYSHFDLTFDLHAAEQRVKLSLEPNHDILAPDARVEFVDGDGKTWSEKIDRDLYKVFLGSSWILEETGRWQNVGWARIVVHRDGSSPIFEGAFTIYGDHHHVQTKSNYMATKHHLDPDLEEHWEEFMTVFRDTDVSRQPRQDLKRGPADRSCQADMLPFNSDPNHPVFQQTLKRDVGTWGVTPISSLFGKRQSGDTPSGGNSANVNLKQSIGSTAGCPSTRKVALIGVATDCTYTASFQNSSTPAGTDLRTLAQNNIITQINSASDLYQKSFNITLGLKDLTINLADCPATAPSSAPWNLPCSNNATITDRLNLFSAWRGQRNDSNAYWTLLTTCNTGAEIGLAWLGQLCTAGVTTGSATDGTTQAVTGANIVVRTSTEWQVIAHESGHTFGAVHDCDSDTCSQPDIVNSQQCCPLSGSTCDAQAQFIMNPSSTPGANTFSPCTIGNICSALGRNSVNSTCLSDNKAVTTFSGSQCGNGIVEPGEDCDCGGTAGCGDNACCDATTCKFKSGAVCDDSNEECCRSCQFSSAGTVCRPSTGQCDPAETCSGTSGSCPVDSTAPDGTNCGNSSQHLKCASGQCTSRDLQCKSLMGSYTQGNDTYACNSQTCSLSCASPEFGIGVCYSMQQNFLDGTPCGGNGKCSNGNCKGSNFGGEVGSWIHDHKTIVIAIASVAGALLLLSLLGCLVRRRRPAPRRRRRRSHGPRAPPPWNGDGAPPMEQPGWSGPPPPWQPMPPMQPAYMAQGRGRQSVRYA